MKILDRYLARCFLRGWLSVNLVFAGLFSFLELARQLDDVGEGSYRLADALLYVLLTLPGRILDLAPPSALLGGILGLGLLSKNLELLALQASGISIAQIGWKVIRPAVLALLALLLGAQFLIPTFEQTAWTRRETALSTSGTLLAGGGFWSRSEQSFINLQAPARDGTQALDLYTFDSLGRLNTFTHARDVEIGEEGTWTLHDVQQKNVGPGHNRTRQMPRLMVTDLLSRQQAAVLALPPQTLSLSALYEFIQALEERGQNAARYRLAFWQKITLPVMTAAMIVLALPFVFGPARSAGFGWRLMVGAILGVAFFFLSQILGYTGLILRISPVWTTLLPALAVLLVGMLVTRRIS